MTLTAWECAVVGTILICIGITIGLWLVELGCGDDE